MHGLRAALFLVVALCAFASGAAADAPASPGLATNTAPATLEIGGRKVVTFRATLGSYPPADRAQNARARLLAAYEKNPLLVLRARHVTEGTQVLADGRIMFLVAPTDVNAAAGDTPEQAADNAIEILRRIIEERAERADPAVLARDAGFAVIATLVAALLLRLVFFLDRRVGTVFSRRVAERAEGVKVSGVSMFDRSHMLRVARRLVHGCAWVLAAAIAYLWLNAVLEVIPFTRPWGEHLTGVLVDTLASVGSGFLDALPGLLLVILILAVARVLSQGCAAFFDRIERSDALVGRIDRHTAKPTRILITLVIWIFAVAMAYPYLPGSESRALQGLSVLLGLMVSLGASSIVGQAASGLILMYSSAFRVGDYVRIQDREGTVTEIGMFITRLRTGAGDEVMLPNNTVLGNVAMNYSRGPWEGGFVVQATVTIGYDTPWRQVHAMLEEAARRTPGVLRVPVPRVFQTKLSDFYVEYLLAARCGVEEALGRAEVISQLHANIQDVFNENGVQIMSPHYLGDPDRPKVVPKAQWHQAPARSDGA